MTKKRNNPVASALKTLAARPKSDHLLISSARMTTLITALASAARSLKGADNHAALSDELAYWLARANALPSGGAPRIAKQYVITLANGATITEPTLASAAARIGLQRNSLAVALSKGGGAYRRRVGDSFISVVAEPAEN